MRTLHQPRRPFPLGYLAHRLMDDDADSRRFQRRFWGGILSTVMAMVLLHVAPQVMFGWPSPLALIFGAN